VLFAQVRGSHLPWQETPPVSPLLGALLPGMVIAKQTLALCGGPSRPDSLGRRSLERVAVSDRDRFGRHPFKP
jgi:hypothetical protein